MFNFFKKKYAFMLTVPSEYRIFSISPVLFCTGLMGNCGITDFDIKIEDNNVFIHPENLDSKMAIAVAKEFVFARSIVLNDIIQAELDVTAFPPIKILINEKITSKVTCNFFKKTLEISMDNVENLKRIMTNRGVNISEVGEEDESVY